ncbi:MAG TPA: rod shape-determining protein RodA [Candidatus Acidoferrales bacterium]|nr:rod shape-determining protein RodA [Candidatus Acidoferrales bacterium]
MNRVLYEAGSGLRAPLRDWPTWLHVDLPLVVLLSVLSGVGLMILYSAGGADMGLLVRQIIRLGLAFAVMFAVAQVPSDWLYRLAPVLYGAGLVLLILVMLLGDIGKGAQRWLDLGVIRFQPSELMKLAMPLMIARYLQDRGIPPQRWDVPIVLVLIGGPVLLIAEQPDLGTAVLVMTAGMAVLFLGGLGWRWIMALSAALGAALPLVWTLMHDYQRQRVLTLFDPEADPLGTGYHIIQSKIALGSGGLFGKGWLNGTQAHLQFLPEGTTDFIFAVYGEEFGFIGLLLLLGTYFAVTVRGLQIAGNGQNGFERLLAASLSFTFLFYVLVNTGMVSGILPVVGVPLPLISYGGTSMVTLLAGFGMLMSIQTHKKMLAP